MDGFVVPLIALFYNDAATSAILESKRKMRLELAAIECRSYLVKCLPWYSVGKRVSGFLSYWRERMAVRVAIWRHQLPEETLNQCLNSPEFEFLKYLHKLTERMSAWRAFPDKHLPPDQLPKEFIDKKGPLDAPLSAYDRLCRIQEEMDAFIPAEIQRTMCALMMMQMMRQSERQSSSETECDFLPFFLQHCPLAFIILKRSCLM